MIYYDKTLLFSHSTISISIINQPLTNFISNSTLVGKVLSVLNGHCIASLWNQLFSISLSILCLCMWSLKIEGLCLY